MSEGQSPESGLPPESRLPPEARPAPESGRPPESRPEPPPGQTFETRSASDPSVNERLDAVRTREAAREVPREGRYIGPVRITLAVIVVAIAFVASLAYIGYVVLAIDEEQIPLLAYGFVVLGACFVAIAFGALLGMWRAASRAAGGRALILAIIGGIAGVAAIGCFTVTALSAMVWNT